MERQAPIAQVGVVNRETFEAPQMLYPALIDKVLDVAARVGSVAQKAP
jgi:hypothetical protein